MKILKQNKAICAVLALVLCLSVLLVACENGQDQPAPETSETQNSTAQVPEEGEQDATEAGTNQEGSETETESEGVSGTETEEGTAAGTESETESQPQDVTYTVSVIGSDGMVRQGALVRFYLGGEQVVMVPTNADGVAEAQLPSDTYEVVIDNILGEKYDATGCIVTPECPALSVKLCALPTEGEVIYAYSHLAGDYVDCNALRIDQGEYWATLTAGDLTYFLFIASCGGVFEISADETLPLSIGYFGSTFFVLPESTVPEENNAIRVEVYDDMVDNYAFVIGVHSEDVALTECVLRVTYVGDREVSEDEMPWTDIMPKGEIASYQKPTGTLRPFDVTSTKLQAVFNPADGYYHVGSADGPVILLNLGNSSPYMDALTTVCNNMRLGVYVYDEDGKLVSKDSYNELLLAYSEASSGGYYPLDQTLANMLQVVGGYIGWYDASSPMYLFSEQPLLVPENAWLFACVYGQS